MSTTKPYTVKRAKTGPVFSQGVYHPNGQSITFFDEDDDGEAYAQNMCDLLNDAYALGRSDQRQADLANGMDSSVKDPVSSLVGSLLQQSADRADSGHGGTFRTT